MGSCSCHRVPTPGVPLARASARANRQDVHDLVCLISLQTGSRPAHTFFLLLSSVCKSERQAVFAFDNTVFNQQYYLRYHFHRIMSYSDSIVLLCNPFSYRQRTSALGMLTKMQASHRRDLKRPAVSIVELGTCFMLLAQ